jgi:hypothetical protein
MINLTNEQSNYHQPIKKIQVKEGGDISSGQIVSSLF